MDTGDLTIAGVQPGKASQDPDHLLLFSSWYFMVDTRDLTIMGVQI